jgi:hypothetical protein
VVNLTKRNPDTRVEGDMADELELSMDPNGEDIKLRWSKGDEPPSKPLRLDIDLLLR